MRKLKFIIVGFVLALFNFLVYTFLARVIFSSNDLLWLDSAIAYLFATVLAYFMHSKITWRDRRPTKTGIVGFFVWNIITMLVVSPLFTWLFSLISPLYEALSTISANLSLPFDYDFIESTVVFCLTTAVTMILNYLFYDRLVFNTPPKWLSKISSKVAKIKKHHIISVLIYAIPVVFFIISYFLLTASGEDIYQGAGSLANGGQINFFQDAINALNFNGRITDMYSWAIIDFYDYQYNFGVDTIFRIIDIIISLAVFYFATYLILDRRPKLKIKDALIFTGFFALFIVLPFGRPFYEEFSMIHNYPPLILVTILFAIPYLKLILKKPPKNHLAFLAVAIFLLGVYFGMATTVTPIAFLITLGLYCLVRHKHLKSLPAWFFFGIVGAVIGLIVSQVVFSTTDHYTSGLAALSFDYVSLPSLLGGSLASFFALAKHFLYNFGVVLVPLFAIYVLLAIFTHNFRFYFSKQFFLSLSASNRRFYITCLTFILIHLLGYTQIFAPWRLLMPPFLIGLVLVFRIYYPKLNSKVLAYATIIFSTLVLLLHSVLLIQYHTTTSEILAEIQASESTDLCIDHDRSIPPHIPVLNLNQVNMIVDWGVPEIIYDKNITFCKT